MAEIKIKLERANVEELFSRYKDIIGKDFPGYRNHVYRTITYAMHFLGNDSELERLVETIFVYHDIGLWTDHELAYLEPSVTIALEDNQKYELGLDPDVLRGGIHWHHKILSNSASLKKKYFVVARDMKKFSKIFFNFFIDTHELFATMRHLKNRHPGIIPI